MAEKLRQGEIFPTLGSPEGTEVINDRCLIKTKDGHRVVMVSGIALSQYALGDHMAEAYAMVSLIEQGWADQNDVARAFGCSGRTVRRHQRRFEDGGLSALGHGSGYPKGCRRLRASRARLIHRLKAEGHSNREIARRVGVSEKAVRKLLRRLGWKEQLPRQTLLPLGDPLGADPNLSAFSTRAPRSPSVDPSTAADPNLSAFLSAPEDPVPFTLDRNPSDRSFDRLMACLGVGIPHLMVTPGLTMTEGRFRDKSASQLAA